MRHIAVSIDRARQDRMRRLYPNLEIFPGTTGCDPYNYRQVCIPDAYKRLAAWAVSEGLDRGSIVMQDDVWMPHGPGFDNWISEWAAVPLLIFGKTESNRGVAPKAFSASSGVWRLLSAVWTGEGRIIPAWMPIVEQYGTVLDVTRGLGSR